MEVSTSAPTACQRRPSKSPVRYTPANTGWPAIAARCALTTARNTHPVGVVRCTAADPGLLIATGILLTVIFRCERLETMPLKTSCLRSVLLWRYVAGGMVELNGLKQFLVVARLEHLSRAAEELHVAQPSLSRTIARLESE